MCGDADAVTSRCRPASGSNPSNQEFLNIQRNVELWLHEQAPFVTAKARAVIRIS